MSVLYPGEVRPDEIIEVQGQDQQDNPPFYIDADVIQERMIQSADEVDQLYAEDRFPKLLDLVRSCQQKGLKPYIPTEADDDSDIEEKEGKLVVDKDGNVQKNYFNRGDWIEYLGVDMKWKMAQVSSVVKQAPDTWDYDDHNGKEPDPVEMNIFYNIGEESDGLIGDDEVRAPTKGLEALFGRRPWLWQQHCLLQLEKRLRFQRNHEHDFQEVDCQKFATKRFQLWLHAVGNEDFLQHFEEQTAIAQKLLETHLLTPFELMDRIVEDKENWDFQDDNITVYTYYGVLGSGCAISLVCFLIQFLSFLVLLFNQFLEIDGEENERFMVGSFDINPNGQERLDFFPLTALFDPFGTGFFSIPTTSLEDFCLANGRVYGKILLFVMILLYCVKVLPDTLYKWFRVSGGDPSTSSKINSLRSIIWDENQDSIPQQIGFKIDRFMNTGFISLLFSSMLLILLATDNLIDIILNALAIEFIHQIDEKLADADWWDRDARWIQAGTMELVMLSTLELNKMRDPVKFCKHYDIKLERYEELLGKRVPLRDRAQAMRDEEDERFMTLKERKWSEFASKARESGSVRAIKQFEKSKQYFGFFEKILGKLGLNNHAMFSRHIPFRTWSRWEEIMFLPSVPFIVDDAKLQMDDEGKGLRQFKADIEVMGLKFKRNDTNLFIVHILSVLSLAAGYDSISKLVANNRVTPWSLLWRILESLLQLFSYLCVLVFPIYLVVALFVYPYCY